MAFSVCTWVLFSWISVLDRVHNKHCAWASTLGPMATLGHRWMIEELAEMYCRVKRSADVTGAEAETWSLRGVLCYHKARTLKVLENQARNLERGSSFLPTLFTYWYGQWQLVLTLCIWLHMISTGDVGGGWKEYWAVLSISWVPLTRPL